METGAERRGGHWQDNQILYEMAPGNSEKGGRWLSSQARIWREINFPRAAQEWADGGVEDLEADIGRLQAKLGGKGRDETKTKTEPVDAGTAPDTNLDSSPPDLTETEAKRIEDDIKYLRKTRSYLSKTGSLLQGLNRVRTASGRGREHFDLASVVAGHPPDTEDATLELIESRRDIDEDAPAIVWDIRTGETRPARLEDMITRHLGVALPERSTLALPAGIQAGDLAKDGAAAKWIEHHCPLTWEFIQQVASYGLEDGIVSGDIETAAALAETAGLCLIGSDQMPWFTVLDGSGRNGKGIFAQLIREIAGDLFHSDKNLLAWQKVTGHDERTANIRGRHAILVDEPEPGINTELLKTITGGGKISASHKGQWQFTFRPRCHLLISTNRPLSMGEPNLALEDRLTAIPFDANFGKGPKYLFPRREPEKIMEELRPERSNFALIAIAMAHAALQRQERASSPRIIDRTKRVLTQANRAGMWYEERCYPPDETEASDFATNKAAHDSYKAWSKDLGRRPKPLRSFIGELKKVAAAKNLDLEFGVRPGTGQVRDRGIRGLRLRSESTGIFGSGE